MRAVLFTACLITSSASPSLRADDKKPDPKAVVAQLAKDFKSSTPRGKIIIIEKLSKLGENAARPLCDAMLDKDEKVATAALVALETAHPQLYKPVALMVLDKNRNNQLRGIAEIGDLGHDGRPALNLLVARGAAATIAAEEDESFEDLAVAYQKAVAEVGDEEPVPFFKAQLESTLPDVRWPALKWLMMWAGEKEPRQKEVVAVIKGKIADNEGAVPFIIAAGKLGSASKELLPTLKRLKLSGSMAVRDAATGAVAAIEAK